MKLSFVPSSSNNVRSGPPPYIPYQRGLGDAFEIGVVQSYTPSGRAPHTAVGAHEAFEDEMSSSQMDDAREHRQVEAIASRLGIAVSDLNKLEWDMEPHESGDGVLYGYNIYFRDGSHTEIVKKIKGVNDKSWIRIGPLFEDWE